MSCWLDRAEEPAVRAIWALEAGKMRAIVVPCPTQLRMHVCPSQVAMNC
jgi:hypothetical protein